MAGSASAGKITGRLGRKALIAAAGLAITAGSLVGLSQPASAASGCNLWWGGSNGYSITGTCFGSGSVQFTYTCVNVLTSGTYRTNTGWYSRPMSYSIPVSCHEYLGSKNWVPQTSTSPGYNLG